MQVTCLCTGGRQFDPGLSQLLSRIMIFFFGNSCFPKSQAASFETRWTDSTAIRIYIFPTGLFRIVKSSHRGNASLASSFETLRPSRSKVEDRSILLHFFKQIVYCLLKLGISLCHCATAQVCGGYWNCMNLLDDRSADSRRSLKCAPHLVLPKELCTIVTSTPRGYDGRSYGLFVPFRFRSLVNGVAEPQLPWPMTKVCSRIYAFIIH